MNLERLRAMCLALPGATEQIQWGADLVFKVGGKMFCVACTEHAPNVMSFKCNDESFAEFCERDGCLPAPYLARAKWVAIETWTTLEDREYQPIVERAYTIVRTSLPRKTQAALAASTAAPSLAARATPARPTPAASASRRTKSAKSTAAKSKPPTRKPVAVRSTKSNSSKAAKMAASSRSRKR